VSPLRALSLAAAFSVAAAVATIARAQTPPAAPSATAAQKEQPSIRDDRDAVNAGLKWLTLIDGGNAGAAWDDSAPQLKKAVTREKFVAAMRELRKPLGKLATRNPVRFARSHEMPGAPSGDYAIIEYEAKFAGGKKLAEVLVWTLADGDIWRVAGYEYR
jgi:hypothetical protein